jgi:hypothetical protein
MKILTGPLLVALLLLVSVTSSAHRQADDATARASIIAFLKAVYQSNLEPTAIAKQYIALSTSANTFST